jgi:hypothetical protein
MRHILFAKIAGDFASQPSKHRKKAALPRDFANIRPDKMP